MNRQKEEVKHFTEMEHIWSGQKTAAGQKRYINKMEMLRKYCKPRRGDKILEIGCGDGLFTRRFKGIKADFIATDLTPAVIERARKKINFRGLKYMVEDCEKLTFQDGYFTLVCGISILHHVDMKKTLMEAYRVLKPGGKIFFTEPNLLNPFIYITTNVSWLRPLMEYSPSERALLRKNVDKTLKDIGFKVVVVKNYDFLFPWVPQFMISVLEKIGYYLEMTPLLKEFSGSLLIYASK